MEDPFSKPPAVAIIRLGVSALQVRFRVTGLHTLRFSVNGELLSARIPVAVAPGRSVFVSALTPQDHLLQRTAS